MSRQMVTFSRHAIRTSGRFLPRTWFSTESGIHHVRPHVRYTHHFRMGVTGISSTSVGWNGTFLFSSNGPESQPIVSLGISNSSVLLSTGSCVSRGACDIDMSDWTGKMSTVGAGAFSA